MSPKNSIPYFTTLLICIFISLLLSVFANIDLKYFRDCTIHLTIFGNNSESVDIASDIIYSNQNGNHLWTVQDSLNDTNKIEPQYEVYEICTINLLIEQSFDQVGSFIITNKYTHLPPSYRSIYIIVLTDGQLPKDNKLVQKDTVNLFKVQSRLFFIVNSHWTFFCPYCTNYFYNVSKHEAIDQVTTIKLQHLWMEILIPLWVEGEL